ncbi:MAG: type II toxin-antitoxin system RelE/ParE family toxin [Pseudomonadales bacterium]
MINVVQAAPFSRWLHNLQDRRARARIAVRLRRLQAGLVGDVRPVGEGVSELRIDYGPGYRLYFFQRNSTTVLLCGGTKASQPVDIRRALGLARLFKEAE